MAKCLLTKKQIRELAKIADDLERIEWKLIGLVRCGFRLHKISKKIRKAVKRAKA